MMVANPCVHLCSCTFLNVSLHLRMWVEKIEALKKPAAKCSHAPCTVFQPETVVFENDWVHSHALPQLPTLGQRFLYSSFKREHSNLLVLFGGEKKHKAPCVFIGKPFCPFVSRNKCSSSTSPDPERCRFLCRVKFTCCRPSLLLCFAVFHS